MRPSLTPALRLGLVGTRPTGALALMAMAQQPVCERTRSGRHEVVHVIYCQSLNAMILPGAATPQPKRLKCKMPKVTKNKVPKVQSD